MTTSIPPKKKRQPKLFSDQEIEDWFESEEEGDVVSRSHKELSQVDVDEKYSKSQLRIVKSTMDLSLHNLKQNLNDKTYINLGPFYQRRNRWDIKKRSQLIESFLMNIPIPPIFLFEDKYNQYEVMDGRQRLETIRMYFAGDFALKGLEYWTELEGLGFEQLPKTLQAGLLRRTLPAVILLAETSRPEEFEVDVRMLLFRRLNTGGIKLNPQELRNAVFPSEFNQMLQRVARNRIFTQIWGIPSVTSNEKTEPSKELEQNTLDLLQKSISGQ